MTERLLEICILLAVVGASVIGGIFFAFSSFVMPALSKVPSEMGVRSMQRINIDVINWHFLGLFFGSAVPALAAAVLALMTWPPARSAWVVIGAALYIIGTLFVTMVCNVPLNDRLAKLDPSAAEADDVWRMYIQRWTRWNHFRSVAAILAAVCLLNSYISIF